MMAGSMTYNTMPYKTDKMSISCPFLDKRTKLIPCQVERMLQLHNEGVSIHKLAKMFKVSRRTIQFKVDPEKKKANLERRNERGGWRQYYDKEEGRKSNKQHRNRKHKLLKNTITNDAM